MHHYRYLLLDLDNTLFDFDRAEREAFHAAFAAGGLQADDCVYALYHEINDQLWKQLERGEITRARLLNQRYEMLLSQLGMPDDALAHNIARVYFSALSQQRFLLPGAEEVCRKLSAAYQLYIITNGTAAVQRSRFDGCGIEKYFQGIFISEDVGASKPSPAFFDCVLERIGDTDRTRYCIIGDSVTSDIAGAESACIDAVWLNRSYNHTAQGHPVSYIVKDIRELPDYLLND